MISFKKFMKSFFCWSNGNGNAKDSAGQTEFWKLTCLFHWAIERIKAGLRYFRRIVSPKCKILCSLKIKNYMVSNKIFVGLILILFNLIMWSYMITLLYTLSKLITEEAGAYRREFVYVYKISSETVPRRS